MDCGEWEMCSQVKEDGGQILAFLTPFSLSSSNWSTAGFFPQSNPINLNHSTSDLEHELSCF